MLEAILCSSYRGGSLLDYNITKYLDFVICRYGQGNMPVGRFVGLFVLGFCCIYLEIHIKNKIIACNFLEDWCEKPKICHNQWTHN